MAHRAYRGRRWIELRLSVLERDGWRCALCGGHIDANLPPGSHELAGTADHIVPIARGGALSDPRNLRAAHVGCNRARGARPPAVQYPPPRRW